MHSSGGAIQIVTATSKQEKEDAIKRREILARQVRAKNHDMDIAVHCSGTLLDLVFMRLLHNSIISVQNIYYVGQKAKEDQKSK